MPKSSGEWDEVARELRRISRILAVIAIRNEESQREQIARLGEMGFLPSEIAKIIDTTPNTVNVALFGIRQKSRQKGKRDKKAK
jgi:DNA-directed RNA polymerase specialized sigma24 family protein